MSVMRIPGPVARPIIQDYIDKYETTEIEGGGKLSPLWILAAESDNKPCTLRSLMNGNRKSIDLYALDRLLSAMGKPYLWWQKPLADFYFENLP